MSGSAEPSEASAPRRYRAAALCLLFVAELLLLAGAYQFLARIECGATALAGACDVLRSLVVRALVVIGAGVLLVAARPSVAAVFRGATPGARGWMLLHGVGVVLLFLPLALAGSDLSARFGQMLPFWLLGGAAALAGGLFWLARLRDWTQALGQDGWTIALLMVGAAILPDVAELTRPFWDSQGLTSLTFGTVEALLRQVSDFSYADPDESVIGVGPFAVQVARQCSGVEGAALVTGFCGLFAVIFRRELRVGRFLAVVLPLGIAASWALNVVRIAALILIGAHVSPDLAVNGFHSYAGWLFFLILALGVLAAAQAVPWFWHKGGALPPSPLRHDLIAASILPFVAFMVAGTATRALMPVPELGDPLIALVLGMAVAFFLPALRALTWSPDAVGIGAGLAVGAGWVLLAPAAAEGEPIGAMLWGLGPGALALWVALRFIGTALLVPVVEEMFFRGYLLPRVAGLAAWPFMPLVAVLVTSAAFGALHGRWVEGTVAGIVFALVALRRGRVTDAVQAHVAANTIVALAAVLRGDVTLI